MLNYFGFTIAQLRILRLQKHKSGWGSRYPGHGILTPPCIPDTLCDYLPRPFEKGKYLRNTYFSKLLWFYNCSIQYFKASEAQIWVGVKIPRSRYLDPHPVFLTHCAISYQDCLENANIYGTITMLNYIGFTITQVRILGLQKHKSGWGSRYPGHGIFTSTVYCRLLDKQNRQLSDFNKICQNDLTRYCHNEIINLLFSKFKKLKLVGGQI